MEAPKRAVSGLGKTRSKGNLGPSFNASESSVCRLRSWSDIEGRHACWMTRPKPAPGVGMVVRICETGYCLGDLTALAWRMDLGR